MEYNTNRSALVMPEYGRNVQKMVEHLKTVEDREERQALAKVIIDLMGTINPQMKSPEDQDSKLWDHLFVIADFDLDVDTPRPVLSKEAREAKPQPLSYPEKIKKNKHLGKNLNRVLAKAMEEENEEKRRGFTNTIAYYMKMAYSNWHHETIHDDMIREELIEISNGTLELEDQINVRTRRTNHRRPKASAHGRNQRGSSNRPNNNRQNNRQGGRPGPRGSNQNRR